VNFLRIVKENQDLRTIKTANLGKSEMQMELFFTNCIKIRSIDKQRKKSRNDSFLPEMDEEQVQLDFGADQYDLLSRGLEDDLDFLNFKFSSKRHQSQQSLADETVINSSSISEKAPC